MYIHLESSAIDHAFCIYQQIHTNNVLPYHGSYSQLSLYIKGLHSRFEFPIFSKKSHFKKDTGVFQQNHVTVCID